MKGASRDLQGSSAEVSGSRGQRGLAALFQNLASCANGQGDRGQGRFARIRSRNETVSTDVQVGKSPRPASWDHRHRSRPPSARCGRSPERAGPTRSARSAALGREGSRRGRSRPRSCPPSCRASATVSAFCSTSRSGLEVHGNDASGPGLALPAPPGPSAHSPESLLGRRTRTPFNDGGVRRLKPSLISPFDGTSARDPGSCAGSHLTNPHPCAAINLIFQMICVQSILNSSRPAFELMQ